MTEATPEEIRTAERAEGEALAEVALGRQSPTDAKDADELVDQILDPNR